MKRVVSMIEMEGASSLTHYVSTILPFTSFHTQSQPQLLYLVVAECNVTDRQGTEICRQDQAGDMAHVTGNEEQSHAIHTDPTIDSASADSSLSFYEYIHTCPHPSPYSRYARVRRWWQIVSM